MSYSDLPTLNAILNSLSALLLLLAFRFIKQKKIEAHKRTMIGVFAVSSLFLISYIIYHYNHGSQPFQGQGWIRTVYFAILLSHTILAMVNLPMAIITLRRGLRGTYDLHKKIAKWTFPIWLYVSVTGVVVYLFLYQLSPALY